ncbi:MAG: monofunctional biosynthetic peptidoglycan transglycosylase [Bacteroidota bacterium]|nr:monofunctional biosynthetic peptidoglycan transglycosylase [Bacteroidota bacterium]MDP4233199.1 monofunctional biosynthetic peptidoglycan transglycosylase [Bacteroidota bacterium]MDP4242182.1 monofunctional biosynthetic peptidoglycan transglycosylase [Bacteroidota bacterium]MDP4287833.1 monofunctional biosynthetic peptidoglycan transglycosylase [Bacteroidota bacterium]
METATRQTTSVAPQLAAGGELPAQTIAPRKRRWYSWLWRIALIALAIPIVQVAALRFINPPVTTMMVFRMFDHLFAGERITWSHTNLGRNEISPYLYSAFVAGEDQRFYQHHGFDLVEIEKAQQSHARHPNRPMRGASTISQQVAKNLFLPPWHSFIRKGVEAYYTVLIEFMWPKERILQMYANVAEFAPNVYGAEEGALFHFKRHAGQLTQQQAAQMASVLPNPKRWSASHPSAYIQRRAARILRQMRGIPSDEDEDGEPD